MTVLCWDSKTLAADKRANDGHLHFTTTKIFKHGDLLIGFSGTIALGHAMREWIANGCKVADFPAKQSTEEFAETVVIRKQKRGKPVITIFEQEPVPYRIENEFYASGCGRDFALAAMYLGKSSKEAVEIACHFSRACGNGIDTLSF